MSPQFNHEIIKEDITYHSAHVWKFVKSFGKSEKKIDDKPIGFLEESYVRFQLMLVEWGRAKVIKVVLALIAFLLLYIVILRHGNLLFKAILGIPAIWYLWKWAFA